jgi:hypothetical protein
MVALAALHLKRGELQECDERCDTVARLAQRHKSSLGDTLETGANEVRAWVGEARASRFLGKFLYSRRDLATRAR